MSSTFIIITIIIILSIYIYISCESFENTLYSTLYPLAHTYIPSIKSNPERPKSLTYVNITNTKYYNIKEILDQVVRNKGIIKGNVIEYPSYFFAGSTWPGCLPRPLYQGSCGSCWGFAATAALSSRFYIESCGPVCKNYPQINFGSLNNVAYNLNVIYKFNTLYLTDVFKYLDKNKNGSISFDEWMSSILTYQKLITDNGTSYVEKYKIYQILVYILNYQSLGSINLFNKHQVIDRIRESYDIWSSLFNVAVKGEDKGIPIDSFEKFWFNEPITLSSEKLITCCNTCSLSEGACAGSTLEEAWKMLREQGTPTASCIGYNLDSWYNGQKTPTCNDVQGPYYSFCSGYINSSIFTESGNNNNNNKHDLVKQYIDEIDSLNMDPVTIPYDYKDLPWTEPQLFRFRAKNVYKVKNDVIMIQREIMERGPVTSALTLYYDFVYKFGKHGGQNYKLGTNPIGSEETSLIYAWDGNQPEGMEPEGHSIVIVGWGSFVYRDYNKEYELPYWICLNSWGVNWGHSGSVLYNNRGGLPENMKSGGYFWIVRGLDMCSIEGNVIAGQPDLDNISYKGVPERYGWGLEPPNNSDVVYIATNIESNTTTPTEGPKDVFTVVYEKPLSGGGYYSDHIGPNTFFVKSMDPPSPFTLFWPSDRPVYKIGSILDDVADITLDNYIKIDAKSGDIIKRIMNIQKNPLIIIDDEQMQVISFEDSDIINVYRAVNNSSLQKHTKNSEIRVMPYNQLSVPILNVITK